MRLTVPSFELRKPQAGEGVLVGEPSLREAMGRLLQRWLRCRLCHERVTAEDDRTVVEGEHVHRRTNPSGIEFEFGCFLVAPGAVVVPLIVGRLTWDEVFGVADAIRALLGPGDAVRVKAGPEGARFVVVGGRPHGEPVVQYGPFVMNTRAQIMDAIRDYQAGKF